MKKLLLLLTILLTATVVQAQTDFRGYVRFVPTVRPSSPLLGTSYFDETANVFYIYDTNGWTVVGAAPSTLGTVTFTGTATLKAVRETKTAPAIASNVLTLDLSAGAYFNVALNANITTLTISNPAPSGNTSAFVLAFTADGSARTISWPVSILWAGGAAPTLTTTNGKVDILTFVTWDGGTTYYGLVSGQNF
jgi:hypothetical protein